MDADMSTPIYDELARQYDCWPEYVLQEGSYICEPEEPDRIAKALKTLQKMNAAIKKLGMPEC